MLKNLRGFNLGQFFAIKVAPQNEKKNCPLISRKKFKFFKLKIFVTLKYQFFLPIQRTILQRIFGGNFNRK